MGEEQWQPHGQCVLQRAFYRDAPVGLHLPCTDMWRTGGSSQFLREKSSSAQSSHLCQCFQKGASLQRCQSRHEPWSSLTLHSFCALMSCGSIVNVTRYTAMSCATLSDRLKPFRTLTLGKQNLHLYCVTLFLLTSAPSPGTHPFPSHLLVI